MPVTRADLILVFAVGFYLGFWACVVCVLAAGVLRRSDDAVDSRE